ncbi:lysozyme inhibitor LprI family protein [Sphingopyxis sp. PET50]|uniref:lysozyme inhibitor LprI family protein n=1 Tax=Sphingopyxis sp. PET50 TaxID=2976533 RepID=UPI0021AE8963|nr:lysozyme inhibitor LprI family protein [Sphingopyxis sp. PET50]
MIAAMLFALAVAAQEPEIDCENPQYQVEMNYCAGRDYDAADAELNAQWKLTVAALKARDKDIDRSYDTQPTHYDTLIASQRAWLTYRDQHCLSESFAARGGSMAPMLHSGCMARLTKERTAELEELAGEN